MKSPKIVNKTLTSADTEYSIGIPSPTKQFTIQCRTAYDVRFAYETGKVATPTAPYSTLKSGTSYNEQDIEGEDLILYLASSEAGVVVELILWKP